MSSIEIIVKSINNNPEKSVEHFCSTNFIQSSYVVNGRLYKEYLLTKDGFTYLVMGFTGHTAESYKVKYINKFNWMGSFIENRELSRIGYFPLVQVLLQSGKGQKGLSDEADLINIIVLGMTSRQFRIANNIPLRNSILIRDYMSPWQVESIQKLQELDNKRLGLRINGIKRYAWNNEK